MNCSFLMPLPRLPRPPIHIRRIILFELRQAVNTHEYPPVRLAVLNTVERPHLPTAVIAPLRADAFYF